MKRVTIIFLVLLLATSVFPGSVDAKSLQAIRTLSFGDSREQARRKVLSDTLFKTPLQRLGKSALSPIGEDDFVIDGQAFDLVLFFNRKGLYRFEFESNSVDEKSIGENFDSITGPVLRMARARFDKPSFTKRRNAEDLEPDAFNTIHFWSSDDLNRPLQVWVGVTRKADEFHSSLILEHSELTNANSLTSNPDKPSKIRRPGIIFEEGS